MRAAMGWDWAGWQRRVRLKLDSLGKGHRGTAGPDTLQGKTCLPDQSLQASQDPHGAHSLHASPMVL